MQVGGLLLEGGMMGLSVSSSGISLSLNSSNCTEWYICTANIHTKNKNYFNDFHSHFMHKQKYFLII